MDTDDPAALGWLLSAAVLLVYTPLAVMLAVADARTRRLPNPLVAALSAGIGVIAAVTAVVSPTSRSLVLTGLVLAALTGIACIAIALVSPGVLGMGDAKTVPAVVLACTLLGWDVLVGGLLGIAVLGGLTGIVVLVRARSMSATFPYGPVLLAAPFLGLLLAPVVRGALGQ